jgi:hypothetical protein
MSTTSWDSNDKNATDVVPRTWCQAPRTLRAIRQLYGVEISRNTAGSLLQVSLAPGRAEDLTRDGGSAGFNTTARYQKDLGAATALAVSGLYREGPGSSAREGAAGVAFGVAPARRVSIWTQGDVLAAEGAGEASLVFVNETAFEAVRGLWLKVSPQLRTWAGVQPRRVRWAYSATFLPRTHWNVNTTVYRGRGRHGPGVSRPGRSARPQVAIADGLLRAAAGLDGQQVAITNRRDEPRMRSSGDVSAIRITALRFYLGMPAL